MYLTAINGFGLDHACFLYIVNRILIQNGGLNQLAPPGTLHAFTIVYIGGIVGTVGTAGLLQACSARALELFSANLLAPVHWPDTAIGDVLHGFLIDLDCQIHPGGQAKDIAAEGDSPMAVLPVFVTSVTMYSCKPG